MALEILNDNLHQEMRKKKKEQDKTLACHIKVEKELVKVTIPDMNDDTDLTLTFPKREVKELLQDLYVG